MKLKAFITELKKIQSFSALFLQENNFQVRYNLCHERGCTDSYLLMMDEATIGYGSIKGQEIAGRDSVFEFYLVPAYKKISSLIFAELLAVSKANFIECQSNDLLLSSMLFEFSQNINAEADHTVTELLIRDVVFRSRIESDDIFEHKTERVGEYMLDLNGKLVATGGLMLHYDEPFTDLYMEVKEDCSRKGLGVFLSRN